jgi:tight adherence protein B
MYIWENGKPVDDLSVTPISQAHNGDFGVVLVIDQSKSMSGSPLAHAMAAARALAAQRTGDQELGVVTFDSKPTTLLRLTSDPTKINHALVQMPWTAGGTRTLPAVALAMRELQAAKIADGAVIVLSDGAANGTAQGLTVPEIGTAAQAQHVRIFTVGLRDSSYTPGLLQDLAQQGGGQFVSATAAQLPQVFTHIAAALSTSYVVRYRSIVPVSEHVAVKIRINGVKSVLQLGYYAKAASPASPASPPAQSTPPSATPKPPIHVTPSHHKASVPSTLPSVTGSTPRLSSTPGFAAVEPVTPLPPPPASTGFWATTLGMLAIAAICALIVGLGVAVLVFRHPARLDVRRRLDTYTGADAGQGPTAGRDHARAGAFASLLTNRRWWDSFVEQVQAGRMKHSAMSLVKRTAVVALAMSTVLIVVVGSVPLGFVPLVLAPFALKTWVARAARKQRTVFADQLPVTLQDLAGAIRAGRSFVGAVTAVAESATEPIASEFDRAITDERLGLPLEQALEAVGERMQAKDMSQVALIAALNRSSGANVAESLERVADGARARADLAREMKALTGQSRMSCWVLTGLPPALLVAMSFIAPAYSHPLFHTTIGIILVIIASCMVVGGWRVMRRIVTPEV